MTAPALDPFEHAVRHAATVCGLSVWDAEFLPFRTVWQLWRVKERLDREEDTVWRLWREEERTDAVDGAATAERREERTEMDTTDDYEEQPEGWTMGAGFAPRGHPDVTAIGPPEQRHNAHLAAQPATTGDAATDVAPPVLGGLDDPGASMGRTVR